MKTKHLALAAFGASLTISAPASAEGWQIAEPAADQGLSLSYTPSTGPTYHFECKADSVLITQRRVTGLVDLATNGKVEDGPDAKMLPGAAMMALSTDKGEMDFMPATVAKNAAAGWDLSIALRKNNKAYRSLARAGMVSLFTTGFTMAVAISEGDRTLLGEFVQRCGTKG